MSTRKYDVIVIGATGYTGELVCKELKKQFQKSGKWGIAGRSKEKLDRLSASLGIQLPTFVFDTTKPETLDAICKEATVVISCAGPFNYCGMPVVEACMRNNTHYIDSTGEFTFVRRVIERFHDEAVQKKLVLVPCCGFDSVPSDLGNYVLTKSAKGADVKQVRCYFDATVAGISSGTAHSIGSIWDSITWKDLSNTSLLPPDAPQPYGASTRKFLWYDRQFGRFSGPSPMAASNERVVRRTNHFLRSRASYSECQQGGFFALLGQSIGMTILTAVFSIPFVRRFVLGKFFPLGVLHGPKEAAKKNCYFNVTFIGETADKTRLMTVLREKKEMYDATAVYLVACAKCAMELSKEKNVVPGVLTPCSAFGDRLVNMCIAEGMQIDTTVMPKL